MNLLKKDEKKRALCIEIKVKDSKTKDKGVKFFIFGRDNKILGKIKQKGISLIPLNLYWDKNHVKVEVGIGKGKKLYDKREDLKRKDAERTIERNLKNSYK